MLRQWFHLVNREAVKRGMGARCLLGLPLGARAASVAEQPDHLPVRSCKVAWSLEGAHSYSTPANAGPIGGYGSPLLRISFFYILVLIHCYYYMSFLLYDDYYHLWLAHHRRLEVHRSLYFRNSILLDRCWSSWGKAKKEGCKLS